MVQGREILTAEAFAILVKELGTEVHEPEDFRQRIEESLQQFCADVRPPADAYEHYFREAADAPPEVPKHLNRIIKACRSLRISLGVHAIRMPLSAAAEESLDQTAERIRQASELLAGLQRDAAKAAKMKKTSGGRHRDAALMTVMLALADIYAEHLTEGTPMWQLPVGTRSPFVRFCATVLQLTEERDFTEESLSQYWARLRRQMKPLPITNH
jgi:hypothetical protein